MKFKKIRGEGTFAEIYGTRGQKGLRGTKTGVIGGNVESIGKRIS